MSMTEQGFHNFVARGHAAQVAADKAIETDNERSNSPDTSTNGPSVKATAPGPYVIGEEPIPGAVQEGTLTANLRL